MPELLVADRPAPGGPDADDPFHHLYCCDENLALCGADLSGTEETGDCDEATCPVCPLCAIADEEGMRCPVPGCTG